MGANYSLVVQYKLEGWGSEADLDKRHWLEDLLDEALRSANNGWCDGGDIGSGTMNIFLLDITDSDLAATSVVNALRNAEALEGAIIAVGPGYMEEDEEDEEEPYRVVWPEGYEGDFYPL